MKKIYLILLVVVLLGGVGTLAFFVTKKKRDSKKSNSKTPIIEPKEPLPIIKKEAESAASIPRKVLPKKSLELDIKVPNVDIGNRRFDYSMHYKGIPYKGTFEDGSTNMVHVKKTFGSFVVKQRRNQEKGNFDIPVGKRDKTAATGKSVILFLESDWVDLAILDSKNSILKQLSVNLRTGETISNAKLSKD